MLSKISGPETEEVTGERRKLHNEEHYVLYLQNILRVIKPKGMRWARRVACMGDRRGAYRVLVRRTEGKRI